MIHARPVRPRDLIGSMSSQSSTHWKSAAEPHLWGFVVRAKLGRGSFSEIFQVEDPSTGQMYALKHVRLPHNGDVRVLARTAEEWEIGSQLTHAVLRRYVRLLPESNLAGQLTGYGLLTEFIDCPPNGQMRFDHERAPVESRVESRVEALECLRRIGCALDSMHAAGFIHCGLRPSCVYLSTLGRARLGGLGDAVKDGTVRSPQPRSPGFCAPEIRRGEAVTRATDSFLFASTAYTLLTEKFHPAAIRCDPLAVERVPKELIGPTTPVANLLPSLPRALCDFIDRALEENSRARPQLHDLLTQLQWHDHQRQTPDHPSDGPRPSAPAALEQRCLRTARMPKAHNSCGAHRQTLPQDAFGYRIHRWLGDGPWSRSYLVEHTATQAFLTLKHVHAADEHEVHDLVRAQESWKLARDLSHPNLRKTGLMVQQGTLGATARAIAILMDPLDCPPLAETQLPAPLSLRILRDASRALVYLHDRSLVHGNIKAQSVFLSYGGVTKLAGTGDLARRGSVATGATPGNDTLSSPARLHRGYAAPELYDAARREEQREEQREGPCEGPRSHAADDRTDVFAFASLAVVLLTGKFAPEVAPPPESREQIPADMLGRGAPLIEEQRGVPRYLSRLFQQSLAADPCMRPSIAELSHALEQVSFH